MSATISRYKIYANICEGDGLYRYRTFVVHAESAQDARTKLSGDWNIDSVRKMQRSEL